MIQRPTPRAAAVDAALAQQALALGLGEHRAKAIDLASPPGRPGAVGRHDVGGVVVDLEVQLVAITADRNEIDVHRRGPGQRRIRAGVAVLSTGRAGLPAAIHALTIALATPLAESLSRRSSVARAPVKNAAK